MRKEVKLFICPECGAIKERDTKQSRIEENGTIKSFCYEAGKTVYLKPYTEY